MKERTSVGISDIHFGQMKSCTKDPFLTDFESSLANVPYSTGYSPLNWKVGVSVMINKSSKVDLVTVLRTATLLEADFDFSNKVQ